MNLKINNKVYKLNVSWHTVTLRMAINISNIEISEDKMIILLNDDGTNTFDDEIIDYIKDVIVILSDIPKDVLINVSTTQIITIWDLISQIIKSLYLVKFDSYSYLGAKSITFNDKVYHMPESLPISNVEEILAHKEPSINIVEISNLALRLSEMKNKGIETMKYICAILLKENINEVYDEEVIVKKAKLFEDLPMNIVFECFFFINYFTINYLLNSLSCSVVEMQPKKQNIIVGFIRWLNQVWQGILKRLKK